MKAAVLIETPRTGAGMDFVKACKKHGIHPVIFIANIDLQPDWVLEDFYRENVDIRQVNSYDIEEVIKQCKIIKNDYDLQAVLSLYEYSTEYAAKAAKLLGLNTPNNEIISILRRKSDFRRYLSEHNLNNVEYQIFNYGDKPFLKDTLDYPVVVKPVNLTGSAFVRKCTDKNMLLKAIDEILSIGEYTGQKVHDEILIEEYIEGIEYSVEVLNGKIISIVQKYTENFIEIGHDLPANLTDKKKMLIENKVNQFLKISNYTFGVLHIELKVNDTGVHFIEANPRVAGGRIPELIRQVYGIDIVEEYLLSLLGYKREIYLPSTDLFASIRFKVAKKDGVVTDYKKLEINNYPSIIEYKFYKNLDEKFEINISNKDRVVHAISIANSVKTNEENIEQFFSELDIRGCEF